MSAQPGPLRLTSKEAREQGYKFIGARSWRVRLVSPGGRLYRLCKFSSAELVVILPDLPALTFHQLNAGEIRRLGTHELEGVRQTGIRGALERLASAHNLDLFIEEGTP